MGRKKFRPKPPARTPKAPRAKMEGLNVKALQDSIWLDREYPIYFRSYRTSKELIKIFKLLVFIPALWHDGIVYETSPEEKLHTVFGTDSRHIFTYKAVQDFTLNVGEINEKLEQIPPEFTPTKLRKIYKDDLILIRVDTRDEELKVDLQVLTCGLFQDTSDDFRNFRIDTSDLTSFRKYLKLVDKDGIEEERFI